jgi:hypothetical protein
MEAYLSRKPHRGTEDFPDVRSAPNPTSVDVIDVNRRLTDMLSRAFELAEALAADLEVSFGTDR